MAIKIQNLEFFSKTGQNLNFVVDNNGIYRANLVLGKGKISTNLIETEQIIILEKVWNSVLNKFEYLKPTDLTENSNHKISFNILTGDRDNFFLFDVLIDNTTPYISKKYENFTTGVYDAVLDNINIHGNTYTNIPNNIVKNKLNKDFNTINVGFSSEEEGSYLGKLEIFIEDENSKDLFAILDFYIDTEKEDERLTLLLDTLGSKINNNDYIIFDKSNIKENDIDFKLLNEKRKELLLEFNNIFPYLGSYQGLINIIKFFGYESLEIKEYWKNIKYDSSNFGKYKPVSIEHKISNSKNWKTVSDLTGSKIWKKTNKFGMYYRINQDSGKFDTSGLPLTENVFDYTLDEILIKLYALKQKLKNYFLPFNSKIVDIVGEALYYTSYDLTTWNVLNKIDTVKVNITPTFECFPSTYGFIKDLRPLEWIGAKIGNDLNLNGETQKRVIEFTIEGVEFGNFITIYDDISKEEVKTRVEYLEDDNIVTFRLFNLLKAKGNPFNQFYITYNENKILFVERFFHESDLNFLVEPGKYVKFDISNNPILTTVTKTVIENGNFSVENYGNAYLSFFYDNNFNINNISNNEDISVGFPILLKNTSFEINWDNANITWDSLDEKELYKFFTNKSELGFPLLDYENEESSPTGLTWDKIGDSEFYEITWRIWKEKDETPAWEKTETLNLRAGKEFSAILPYKGKYNVELTLYDNFGSFSRTLKNNFIEVEQQNPDFTSWKTKELLDVKWDDFKNIKWDELPSTWDLPFLPNERTDYNYINWMSIDRIEFYQNLVNQDTLFKSKYDATGQTWKNIGDKATWNDFNHLYWDLLSPTFTKFIISDLQTDDVTITVKNEFGNILETLTINIEDSIYINNTHYDRYTNFIDKIYDIDSNLYPILSSFIYDIRFQNTSTTVNNISKTIVAVSKEFEKPQRYYFEINGDNKISEFNTPINGFGVLGDSPSSFDIYTTKGIEGNIGTSKITINDLEIIIPDFYNTSLDLLIDYLRQSNLSLEWDFNIVKNAMLNNSPNFTPYVEKYIICSKKFHIPNETIFINYENVHGTKIARSITTNATWSSLDTIYYQRDIKPYTQIYFNYDISKMPGFKNPVWQIINTKTNELIFEWKNKYMTYLFVDEGEYTISLQLEDTNGNKKTTRKNGFIRIKQN